MKPSRILAVLLSAFIFGALFMVDATTNVTYAKGVVKSQPKDDGEQNRDKNTPREKPKSEESREKDTPRESQKETPKESSQESRDKNESRSDSDRNVTSGHSESRSDTTYNNRHEENNGRQEATPDRRGSGTRDVGGQIEKRSEEKDPEYKFRKHYEDHFFYPYDYDLYSSYPWYDRGSVIIIDDLGRHRPSWRRSYGYDDVQRGSLEEALVDIEATWYEEDPIFFMWHIDPAYYVEVYYSGRRTHVLSARQVSKLTSEALDRTRTEDFHFVNVDKHSHDAVAEAVHEYRGPDGERISARITYYLRREPGRWIITRMDIDKGEYGSPKCFIATAAYGTPMSSEVLVLRKFRDNQLLTNAPGRLFVSTYYRVSPPIARFIAHHDTLRAITRVALKPMIWACKHLG